MAYTTKNFKTKKAVKDAITAGEKLTCYQPGPFGETLPINGTVYLEGPHYPEPHKWYGKGILLNGFLVKSS